MENNSWKINTLCCYNNVYTLVRLIYGTHCELQTWVFLSWNPIVRDVNMNCRLRLYKTLWKLTSFKVKSRIHAKLVLSNCVDVTCFKYHVVISQQTKCCPYVIHMTMPYKNIGRQTLDRILCRAELSVCFNVKHFCCIMIGENLTRVFPLYLRSDYLKCVFRQGTFMYSYVLLKCLVISIFIL